MQNKKQFIRNISLAEAAQFEQLSIVQSQAVDKFNATDSGSKTLLVLHICAQSGVEVPGDEFYKVFVPAILSVLSPIYESHHGVRLRDIGYYHLIGFSKSKYAIKFSESVMDSVYSQSIAWQGMYVRLDARIGIRTDQSISTKQSRNNRSFQEITNLSPAICFGLVQRARFGQIFASETTLKQGYGWTGSDLATFDHGRFALPYGKPDQVYEICWGHGVPQKPLCGFHGILPNFLNRFVGREDEIANLTRAFQQSHVVALTAGSGMGKTRLAYEFICRVSRQSNAALFQGRLDAVYWVRLDNLPSIDAISVANALRRTFGEQTPPSIGSALDESVAFLMNKTSLLVFDSCEIAISDVASVCTELLRKCPNVYILACTHRPLEIFGVEKVVHLGPMSLPSDSATRISEIEISDAFRMFHERAKLNSSYRRDYSMQTLTKLLHLTLGMPLALEFVAARAYIGLEALLKELEQSPSDTMSAPDGFPVLSENHKSLAKCIAYTYSLLRPNTKYGFLNIGIFVEAFDAKALAGVSGLSEGQSIRVLRELCDASLVAESEFFGVRYYSAHNYTKLCAFNLIDIANTPNVFSGRDYAAKFVEYFSELSVKCGGYIFSLNQLRVISLEKNWRNAEYAAVLAAKRGQWKDMVTIVRNLSAYLLLAGHWDAKLRMSDLLLNNLEQPVVPPFVFGRAHHGRGLVCMRRRQFEQARREFDSALSACSKDSDNIGCGLIYNSLGNYYVELGKVESERGRADKCDDCFKKALRAFDDSIEYFSKPLDTLIEHGSDFIFVPQEIEAARAGAARPRKNKGVVAEELGDRENHLGAKELSYATAIDEYEAALRMFEELSDGLGQAEALTRLGKLMAKTKRFDESEQKLQRALVRSQQLLDIVGQARAFTALGLLYKNKRSIDESVKCYHNALSKWRLVNDSFSQAKTFYYMALANRECGRKQATDDYAEQACNMFHTLGETYWAERARTLKR